MKFETKRQAQTFARSESRATGILHKVKRTFYYAMPSMEVRKCWTVILTTQGRRV